MKVFDIMSEHIVTVGLGEPVAAAARLLKQYNIGAVPVCDARGNLRGMITDRDIAVRCVANGLSPAETKTGDIMTRGVITINDNAYVGDAARLMADAQIRRLPVCRNGQLGRHAVACRSCAQHRLRHRGRRSTLRNFEKHSQSVAYATVASFQPYYNEYRKTEHVIHY